MYNDNKVTKFKKHVMNYCKRNFDILSWGDQEDKWVPIPDLIQDMNQWFEGCDFQLDVDVQCQRVLDDHSGWVFEDPNDPDYEAGVVCIPYDELPAFLHSIPIERDHYDPKFQILEDYQKFFFLTVHDFKIKSEKVSDTTRPSYKEIINWKFEYLKDLGRGRLVLIGAYEEFKQQPEENKKWLRDNLFTDEDLRLNILKLNHEIKFLIAAREAELKDDYDLEAAADFAEFLLEQIHSCEDEIRVIDEIIFSRRK